MNIKNIMSNNKVPTHVAIIMDGNRRWAKSRNLPTAMGHREGVKRLIELVESAPKLGIQSLTVYAFSTENWGREKKEVDVLMDLLSEYMIKELDRVASNGIKINLLGNIDALPIKVKKGIENALQVTKDNTKFNLNIALSYGGRSEIISAVKNVLNDIENNKINIDDLSEDKFKDYLFTKNLPDPDFLIRTGGETRISNFLLYQMAYTEFYFTDLMWPDFKYEHFLNAIEEFSNRKRRFGKQ